MVRDKFNIFHWEFYEDEGDPLVYVYETRSGDVIGYMTDGYDLNTIRKLFDNKNQFCEDDVNYFIDDNIIWF